MTLSAADISGTLAADGAALDRIRAQAKSNPQAAVKAAAQQFEALLLNMLLEEHARYDLPEHAVRQRADPAVPVDARPAVRAGAGKARHRPRGHHRATARPRRRRPRRRRAIRIPDAAAARSQSGARRRAADRAGSRRARRIPARASVRRSHVGARGGSRAPDRHIPAFHTRAGGAGKRLGPQRDSWRRRHAQPQPVRRQGGSRVVGTDRRGGLPPST